VLRAADWVAIDTGWCENVCLGLLLLGGLVEARVFGLERDRGGPFTPNE